MLQRGHVVLPGSRVQRGRAAGRRERRPGRRQAEVLQDRLDHGALGDEGDRPPAATAGTGEHVFAEDALEQLRPWDLGVWPAWLRVLCQWRGLVRFGWPWSYLRRGAGCCSSPRGPGLLADCVRIAGLERTDLFVRRRERGSLRVIDGVGISDLEAVKLVVRHGAAADVPDGKANAVRVPRLENIDFRGGRAA